MQYNVTKSISNCKAFLSQQKQMHVISVLFLCYTWCKWPPKTWQSFWESYGERCNDFINYTTKIAFISKISNTDVMGVHVTIVPTKMQQYIQCIIGLHVPGNNSFKPWKLHNRCPHIVVELQNISYCYQPYNRLRSSCKGPNICLILTKPGFSWQILIILQYHTSHKSKQCSQVDTCEQMANGCSRWS